MAEQDKHAMEIENAIAYIELAYDGNDVDEDELYKSMMMIIREVRHLRRMVSALKSEIKILEGDDR